MGDVDSDWVAPEAGATVAPGAMPAPSAPPPIAPFRANHAPNPVALRPMTAADLLDGAFAVFKTQPGKIIRLVAVFVVPVQLISAFMQRNLLGGANVLELFQGDSSVVNAASQNQSAAAVWAPYLLLLAKAMILPFVCGAMIKLVGGWHAGQDPPIAELLRAVGRKWWVLLISWFLVHVLEGFAALACFFPALLVMALFICTAPVALAEDLGPIAAMRRSSQLARRRFWPTLGLGVLSGAVAYLVNQTLGLLPQFLGLVVGLKSGGWVLLGIGGIAAELVVTPLVAITTALLYLDLRVRTEGLDLELQAIDVFDRAR